MPDPTVVQPAPQVINMDQVYREYGEATIQLKMAQGRVNQLELTIQQIMNQQAANLPIVK